jgi:hypothetical protein
MEITSLRVGRVRISKFLFMITVLILYGVVPSLEGLAALRVKIVLLQIVVMMAMADASQVVDLCNQLLRQNLHLPRRSSTFMILKLLMVSIWEFLWALLTQLEV